MTEVIGKCWGCGREMTAAEYGRESLCLGCGKATRCCRNCRWYDPARAQQCQEPMAEAVQEKERANYCEFFEPTSTVEAGQAEGLADALQAAEDLFK